MALASLKTTTRTARWSIAQYLAMPDNGRQYELFKGELVMSPSAFFQHGRVAGYIFGLLDSFVTRRSLGLVGMETDVIMSKFTTVLRPDVCFVAQKNLSNIKGHIWGPPDLVVEVTSPANRESDLYDKRDDYERFGVREYWVLDIADKRNHAYQWRLKGGLYHGGLVEKATLKSTVLKGFTLKLKDVWRRAE